MNFKAYGNARPHQYIHTFTLEKSESGVMSDGYITSSKTEPKEVIFDGILATATESEKDAWSQRQHPISHTIVSYHPAEPEINEGDVLSLEETGRKYIVQGITDPGGNGQYALYFVLCREDL